MSFDGAADDQYEPVVRQRRRLERLLAGLTDADWETESRCAGWSVQDVVAHLVGVNAFWHASVVAGLAGALPTRVLVGFDPAATPPLLIASMSELTPAAVLRQFVASNDALLGVLADVDAAQWSTLAETPAGHVPMRLLAEHALWDGWIARARHRAAARYDAGGRTRRGVVVFALRGCGESGVREFSRAVRRREPSRVAASDPDVAFVVDLGEIVRVPRGGWRRRRRPVPAGRGRGAHRGLEPAGAAARDGARRVARAARGSRDGLRRRPRERLTSPVRPGTKVPRFCALCTSIRGRDLCHRWQQRHSAVPRRRRCPRPRRPRPHQCSRHSSASPSRCWPVRR